MKTIKNIFSHGLNKYIVTKIKCYELDFGDTNLIVENINGITDWIESDMKDMT